MRALLILVDVSNTMFGNDSEIESEEEEYPCGPSSQDSDFPWYTEVCASIPFDFVSFSKCSYNISSYNGFSL